MLYSNVLQENTVILIIIFNIFSYLFIFYFLFFIFYLINLKNLNFTTQFYLLEKNNFFLLNIIFIFFSFAGIPPFLGFFSKFTLVSVLLISNNWFYFFLFFIFNIFVIYFYIQNYKYLFFFSNKINDTPIFSKFNYFLFYNVTIMSFFNVFFFFFFNVFFFFFFSFFFF